MSFFPLWVFNIAFKKVRFLEKYTENFFFRFVFRETDCVRRRWIFLKMRLDLSLWYYLRILFGNFFHYLVWCLKALQRNFFVKKTGFLFSLHLMDRFLSIRLLTTWQSWNHGNEFVEKTKLVLILLILFNYFFQSFYLMGWRNHNLTLT